MISERRFRFVVKPMVFALCLGPLAWLGWNAYATGLGANPIEYLNRFLGDWALRFLLIALAVTPVRELTGWSKLGRFRRMLGLYAFFYVCLHLLNWVAIDQFFDWRAIGGEIVKRIFIAVGMACFALLLPLAVTSTKGMIKRIGGVRWQRLHRAVYLAGILGCIHYYMMVKADTREPLVYAGILLALLGWRVVRRLRRSAAPAKTKRAPATAEASSRS